MQKSKLTKLLCVVLSLLMILGAAPITAFAATSYTYLAPVYVDGDPAKGIEWETKSVEATPVINSTTTLSTGWYVVIGDVQTSNLTVNGNVNLILADGSKLTATGTNKKAGITVSESGKSLTVYAQSDDNTGTLIATGDEDGAGIGGGFSASGSNITINGGNVTASGGRQGAGIGGGEYGSGENITINGGTVTAIGGEYGAGIGGGLDGSGENITVNGGTVTATGGKYAAGIGGGESSTGSDITVNGGTVTATGGLHAAGIGGGMDGSGFNITVAATIPYYYVGSSASVVEKKDNDGTDIAEKIAGYRYFATPAHTHSFATAWSHDANGHWHTCTAAGCDITSYATCGLAGAAYGAHTYENGKCTVCGYRCTHTFENGTCTVCGAADKITNGELLALVGNQKFVSSTGIVFSTAPNASGSTYNLYFDKTALTIVDVSDKDVEVTSYGYKLTSTIYDGAGGYIDNYYEFYFDGTGFTKLVCSNLTKAERNDTYLPYHPVTQVSVKDATCTENGVNTAYWICTDEGCGKAFTDNTCATEIPAETLAAYIIPATGHDFTGDYVVGTGDNAGKHARKCVNTGCTAVGLEGTANAYEAHTGMDDFTCDICEYDGEDEAKAAAKAEVAAAAADCKYADTAAAYAAAYEDIDNAESVDELEKAVLDIKEYIVMMDNLKDGSIADLEEKALTASDVGKTVIAAAIIEIKACVYAADVGEIVDGIDDAIAAAEVEAFANAKTEAKTEINDSVGEEESDAVKAIAAEATAKIDEAETIEDIDDIVEEYKEKIMVQQTREDYISSFEGIIAEGIYSDKIVEMVQGFIEEVKDIDSMEELEAFFGACDVKLAHQFFKDDACDKLPALAGEDPSDKVMEIINDAIDAIQSIEDTPDFDDVYEDLFEAIIEQAEKDVAAQKALEADMAAFEEYKLAQAENCAKLEQDGDSQSVKEIIAATATVISMTSYNKDKTLAQNKAEIDELVGNLENNLPVIRAYEAAVTEITQAAGEAPSEAMQAIMDQAFSELADADTVEAVNAIKAQALDDVAEQQAKEAAEALEALKGATITVINTMKGEAVSDEAKALADKAIAAVENAETVEELDAAFSGLEEAMAAKDAELAQAKADAKTAVEALAGDDASYKVKNIVKKALADIEKAANVDALEAIVAAAKEAVEAQKAAEALAAAKIAAKAEIDAALADDADNAVKAAANEAKAAIDAATTVEGVEAAKTAGLEKMATVSDVCPYCGMRHQGVADSFACMLLKIVKYIIELFDFLRSYISE